MRDMRLHVAGMASRRDVREVTARLRDVPGVETVMADATTSQVRLGGMMTDADVLAAFGDTRFRSEIVE